jgi:hypothetical protein
MGAAGATVGIHALRPLFGGLVQHASEEASRRGRFFQKPSTALFVDLAGCPSEGPGRGPFGERDEIRKGPKRLIAIDAVLELCDLRIENESLPRFRMPVGQRAGSRGSFEKGGHRRPGF